MAQAAPATPFIILNFSNNLIKTPGLLLVLSTKILSLVGSRNFQPLLTKIDFETILVRPRSWIWTRVPAVGRAAWGAGWW